VLVGGKNNNTIRCCGRRALDSKAVANADSCRPIWSLARFLLPPSTLSLFARRQYPRHVTGSRRWRHRTTASDRATRRRTDIRVTLAVLHTTLVSRTGSRYRHNSAENVDHMFSRACREVAQSLNFYTYLYLKTFVGVILFEFRKGVFLKKTMLRIFRQYFSRFDKTPEYFRQMDTRTDWTATPIIALHIVFRKKHPLTFSFISPRIMRGLKQKLQWVYPRKGKFWQCRN